MPRSLPSTSVMVIASNLVDHQFGWRLTREERHNPRLDGAAIRASEIVKRSVAQSWVMLDSSDGHHLATLRTGFTDLKLHRMSFRFQANDDSSGDSRFFGGKAERFAMASQPDSHCELSIGVVSRVNVLNRSACYERRPRNVRRVRAARPHSVSK
jgi:hypothetical protein